MTLSDPIFQHFSNHLVELYNDPTEIPNEILINKLEDKIRYDQSIQGDLSILDQLAPRILQIIESNETTSRTKKYAIKFLDILLPYYSFNQILSTFSENLLAKAFSGNDYLKKVLAKVLERGDANVIAHGPLFLCLFRAFANPYTQIPTVNAVQRAILKLTRESDEIRQMYLNNSELTHILDDMKSNKLVQSRAIDLIVEILPLIPTLPTSLYLVTEEELAVSDDLLFYRFTVGVWRSLLHQIDSNEILSFLKEKMRPQIDFCCRRFIGEKTLLDNDTFIDYEDFGVVFFLVTLSFAFTDYFEEYDQKYHIVKYAIETYNHYLKSLNFLMGVNMIYLKDSDELYDNLRLSNATTTLFCRFLEAKPIFRKQITVDRFPPSSFDKLIFGDVLQIFGTLVRDDSTIKMLLHHWNNIFDRILNAHVVDTNVSNELQGYLWELYSSEVPSDETKKKVYEKIMDLKNNTSIVEDPLTERI